MNMITLWLPTQYESWTKVYGEKWIGWIFWYIFGGGGDSIYNLSGAVSFSKNKWR